MGLRPLAQLTRGGRGGTRPGGPAQAGAPRPRPSKQGRRHAPHCHHPGQLRAVARRGCALRAPNGRRQAPAQTGPIRHREGQGPASGSPESPANLAGGRLPVRSPASLRQRHARPVAPQGSALQGTARCRHLPSRDHPASARSVAAAAANKHAFTLLFLCCLVLLVRRGSGVLVERTWAAQVRGGHVNMYVAPSDVANCYA